MGLEITKYILQIRKEQILDDAVFGHHKFNKIKGK